jgi:cytochrome P450
MATQIPYTPPQPARVLDWVPSWRGMFGERVRNALYGIPEPIFDVPYKKRSLMGMPMYVINDPDMIGRIFLDNKVNYERPSIGRRILRPVIGNSLLNAEREDWKLQRKIVAPTFAPHAVEGMAGLMAATTHRQMASWPAQAARMDMAKTSTQTTMAIIADTLFSGEPRLASAQAAQHIDNLVAVAGQARPLTLLGLMEWDPAPVMVRARRSRRYLRQTLEQMVIERGRDGGKDDFFGRLIKSFHTQMPATEARMLSVDNAITFYIAGHETTANALTWASFLLADQPDLQEQARAEAQAALAGDIETAAERMPLLRQILDETMRLYPPAIFVTREAMADDMLGALQIKKGDLLVIYPWIIHRHRALWDQPDSFIPERFAPGNKARQHRFQYLPFGAGPRICVGARFAVTEALIVLAHWLTARRFSVPAGFTPLAAGSITLRTKNGMALKIEPV